ncbi:hypothetical protein BJ912DRAFT_1148350 [Pholiota molesta]|nr:hypothetical protein BJ912DRAFT_1148350 [Pholiota molesta]
MTTAKTRTATVTDRALRRCARGVNTLRDAIDTRAAPVLLHSRTWVVHWSPFVYFDHPQGRTLLLKTFLAPMYLNTIQMSCPWVLRYVAAAAILSRKTEAGLAPAARRPRAGGGRGISSPTYHPHPQRCRALYTPRPGRRRRRHGAPPFALALNNSARPRRRFQVLGTEQPLAANHHPQCSAFDTVLCQRSCPHHPSPTTSSGIRVFERPWPRNVVRKTTAAEPSIDDDGAPPLAHVCNDSLRHRLHTCGGASHPVLRGCPRDVRDGRQRSRYGARTHGTNAPLTLITPGRLHPPIPALLNALPATLPANGTTNGIHCSARRAGRRTAPRWGRAAADDAARP